MEFRTELSVVSPSWRIGWNDAILTLGSCFSTSMGELLTKNKFDVLSNPFGVIYHPLALHKVLRYAAIQEYPPDHTYALRDDVYINFDFNSSLSALSESELKKRIHQQIDSTHHFLKQCKVILLTYGTAWLYQRKDTGEPVANCHKLPSHRFTRRLSTVDELTASFKALQTVIQSRYPDIHWVLTVSPVRHLKDTLQDNSLSKSILRIFCEQAVQSSGQVSYFPSFEIMLDDLRDYRFYQKDMIHPTTVAEEYIWNKFSDAYFNSQTLTHLRNWSDLLKALQHRPFHGESKASVKFLQNLLTKLDTFEGIIDISSERAAVKSMITEAVQ